VVLAVLLLADQLRIFFLLGAPAALSGGAALPGVALLGLDFVLLVLAVDLVKDLSNAGVWVGLDEVAEQIRQAEEVAEPPDGIIILPELASRNHAWDAPWTRRVGSVSCPTCSCGVGSPRSASCGF
jgi:hypothetical protein